MADSNIGRARGPISTVFQNAPDRPATETVNPAAPRVSSRPCVDRNGGQTGTSPAAVFKYSAPSNIRLAIDGHDVVALRAALDLHPGTFEINHFAAGANQILGCALESEDSALVAAVLLKCGKGASWFILPAKKGVIPFEPCRPGSDANRIAQKLLTEYRLVKSS